MGQTAIQQTAIQQTAIQQFNRQQFNKQQFNNSTIQHAKGMSLQGKNDNITMNQYRKSPRANFIDYDYGDYFITICTKDKQHFFGEVHDGIMVLNDVGKFVDNQLSRANEYSDEIEVIQHVVMPNHIHAIVRVDSRLSYAEVDSGMMQRNPNPVLRANSTCQRHVPTLSKYVSSLKGVVTKYAKSNNLEFGWQSRYNDHLIRGTRDGNNISEYISNNVAKWQDDCFYT